MIKNDLESYQPHEGRLSGIYRGVVEDNNDPEKAGRCIIRVFGVHTKEKIKEDLNGIPTDEIPWAEPAFGLFEGSVSGHGAWTVPLQGSHVFVFFEGENPLSPRFFATAPGIPEEAPNGNDGFNDPDEEYPESSTEAPHNPHGLGEPDFHRLGRNEGIGDTIVQSKTDNKDTGVSTALGGSWDEPDPYYTAEYPDNKVFSTRSGITIEIDDTDGEERIHVYHPSNSYIEINKDGDIVVRNANDKFEIIDNDLKKHISNNYDRTVDGSRTSKISSNEDEEIGGNRTREIGGNNDDTISGNETKNISGNLNATISGSLTENTGSTVNRTAGGAYTISAPIIQLN